MKIVGRYKVYGYAVVVEIINTSPDDFSVTEERIITFCLDDRRAESVFNALVTGDLFSESELDTVEEITLRLEEWKFSNSDVDFSREEIKTRQLR
jgi:hypothetical protein